MPRDTQRCRKRKFHGNRHSKSRDSPSKKAKRVGDEGTRLSASARKITAQNPTQEESTSQGSSRSGISGYRFVDMELLGDILGELPCLECGELNSIVLEEDHESRKGCASLLRLVCKSCGHERSFYTSKKIQHYFEVNRRLVYAMRTIGQGASAATQFCGVMNMPPPPNGSAYSRHNKALLKDSEKVSRKTMEDAAAEVKTLKGLNQHEFAECGVSCDGTWQRRGYSSLNGCISVLSIDTGKVLDCEVMTKVCHLCKRHENETDPEKKRLWEQEHAGKCKANHTGSSPAMETKGITRIFNRSQDKHQLVYKEYYGDGDGKGFDEVKDTYSDLGIEVVKKECIGHIQKRVGTALRKKKKETKGLGGRGRLTDNMIDKLQNYYGIAIRSNNNSVAAMKKAILASFFHCASSSKRYLHDNCPDGSESWCGHKKDIANKTKLFKPGPGLPDDVIAAVKPIYARLSEDSLLEKCLHGKTQNQNESFNGMIWERLPKGVFVGPDTLKLGVSDAIAHFNIGTQAALNTLKEGGVEPGDFCTTAMRKVDSLRIRKAEYKSQDKNKQRRKVLRGKRKKKDDKAKDSEGVTYAAGAF